MDLMSNPPERVKLLFEPGDQRLLKEK